MRSATWGVLAGILGLAITAHADTTYKGKTEFGIFAGGLLFEGDATHDTAGTLGGRLGHYITNNIALEALVATSETDDNGSTKNSKILLPMGEVSYHFGKSRFRPFLALGAGVMDADRDSTLRDRTDTVVGWGGGVKYMLYDFFALRVDGRHIANLERGESEKNMGLLTVGASWFFSGCCASCKTPAPAAVAAKPVDKDTDVDGVLDKTDACPNTPAGTKVDARGCSVAVDSDGDGVLDSADACPGTPAGTKVDARGCPQSAAVIQQKEWVLKGLQFDTASANIKAASFGVLDEAVQVLKDHPAVKVEIQGHTDNMGDDAFNQGLSERRAESVKAYLTGKGVDASRLSTRGFGETAPKADNNTAAGRADNRRIEFKVLAQ
jgi:OmpA-OmpF porin, OOP family